MILRNTSRYPTDEVRTLVLAGFDAAHASHVRVAVHVKNSWRGAVGGMAYRGIPSMSSAAASAEKLVTLRLGAPESFPSDNMVTTVKWGPWLTLDELHALEPHPPGCAFALRSVDGRHRRGVPVRHPYGGQSSPLLVYADWREGLIAIAAHEARHLFQFRSKRSLSEVDCERAAEKALAVYRNRAGEARS